MANVKGTSIRGRLKYVERHFGVAALDKVLGQLKDQEVANVLKVTGAMRASWYPISLFVDLSQCIDRVCGNGDGKSYRQMSSQIAQDDLSTIYKVFFIFASPKFIIVKASQVWRQYYDSGEMKVLSSDTGHVELEVAGFDEPHRVHCESVAGWAERALVFGGGKQAVITHDKCRGEGASRCLFHGTWSE